MNKTYARFLYMEPADPVAINQNSAFFLHAQRAILLFLYEQNLLTDVQYQCANKLLHDQYGKNND